MLFISPPFGNYLNIPQTMSIKGSFTIEERSGLLLQIINTLRYSLIHKGWINKIGLRNKGINNINHFIQKNIYSIAILDKDDIKKFNEIIPNNTNIEINVSCPNVKNKLLYDEINTLIHPDREWCIVKISPVTPLADIDTLYKRGFRQFHCCNTYPSDTGGISGSILIPHVKKYINYIKTKYPDTEVIAGGGISNIKILKEYQDIGADHFSISTVCFNPFLFTKLYYDWSTNYA